MNPQISSSRRVLHSWKEISNYTGRGVRTIQRYEVQLGFPVHRPAGSPRSAVLAFCDEIDAWLNRSPVRCGPLMNALCVDEIYRKARLSHARAASMQKQLENTTQLLAKLNNSMLKAMEHRSRPLSTPRTQSTSA
jgi:hypothetical protein